MRRQRSKRRAASYILFALVAVAGAAPAGVRAQEAGGAVGRATRVEASPVVDGRLDDAAWQAAEPIGGFVQREPVEGLAGSERTEVRIVWDDDALYVGAWLYDRDPSAIVFGETRRSS
jgi:hypothetical protein